MATKPNELMRLPSKMTMVPKWMSRVAVLSDFNLRRVHSTRIRNNNVVMILIGIARAEASFRESVEGMRMQMKRANRPMATFSEVKIDMS